LDTITAMKYLAAPFCLALMLCLPPAIGQAQAPTPSMPTARKPLTPNQKSQIDQIRQDSRQRIQILFSDEQRKTYAGLRQRGVSASQAIEMIDLDRSRRDQLRQILRESASAIVKVLGQP
jgi:hypothetical protein